MRVVQTSATLRGQISVARGDGEAEGGPRGHREQRAVTRMHDERVTPTRDGVAKQGTNGTVPEGTA